MHRERARAQAQRRGAVFGTQFVVARGLRFEKRHDRVESRAAKLAVDLVHRRKTKALADATVDRRGGSQLLSQRYFPGQRGAGLAAARIGGGVESILRRHRGALPAYAESELGPFAEAGVVLREQGLIALGRVDMRGRTGRRRGSVEQIAAGSAARQVIPIVDVDSDDEAVLKPQRRVRHFQSRGERPDLGTRVRVGIGAKSGVVLEKGGPRRVAVAEFRRELSESEGVAPGEGDARTVPFGKVPGIRRAAPIGLELRSRARAWKSEILPVQIELEREIPLRPEQAHGAAEVFLLDAVICAIVVRGVVVRKHVESDVLTGDARPGANLVGAVGSRRTADGCRARARWRRSGDDVDGSTGRAPSVQYGPGAVKNLDALDAVQRNRRPANRRELDLIQPLAVQQHEGVLVPGYAEAAHVDLPVRPAGAVPREDPRLLRQQLGQRFRGALPDLLGGDDGHAYRGFEPAFWKTCCGNDDGGLFRALSERKRRRGRDERGNDGWFQGFLPRHASPRAELWLREEMQRRSTPVSHRAPRHFPPSIEAGLRARGIGAYRLPGSSRSQWQGLESDARRRTLGLLVDTPAPLTVAGAAEALEGLGTADSGRGNPSESSILNPLPHLFPVSPRREVRAGTPRTSALIVQHKSAGLSPAAASGIYIENESLHLDLTGFSKL